MERNTQSSTAAVERQRFHHEAATTLTRFYADNPQAPAGWQETLAWHWEQAGNFREATAATLQVAEARVGELAFAEARRWAEHGLELLDRLDSHDRQYYEMQAYALTVAVLEFGGQYREALGYARLLCRLAEAHGNVEALGRTYLTIGRVQRELAQLNAAESETLRALALAERHYLPELEAETRLHLAKIKQMQGHHLEAFQQLEILQEAPTDNIARLARVFTTLGDVYRVLGSGLEALKLYHRALKLEISSTNRMGQAILYEKLGLSNLELGQYGAALQCIQESLRIRITLNDVVGQARAQSILGTINSRLSDYQQALSHYEQARDLESRAQNQRGLIIALNNLGDVAQNQGDGERARSYYLEALGLARTGDDRVALARTHQRLGDVNFTEHRLEAARNHWAEALRIREELGHSEEAIALRGRLGVVSTSSG